MNGTGVHNIQQNKTDIEGATDSLAHVESLQSHTENRIVANRDWVVSGGRREAEECLHMISERLHTQRNNTLNPINMYS